jgi:peptidoglycan hydrolase CwlO-like protein
MTSMPLEQKVRQLDNDVQALYELVHQISTTQMRHTNRFNEITADLVAQGERLGSLETKVGTIDARVGALDAKVEALDAKVEALDAKVDVIDTKVDTILDLLRAR